jgi:hypothetical protein
LPAAVSASAHDPALKKTALVLAVFLSLALRVYSLGRGSYWIDEMVSLHIAKAPGLRPLFWDNSPFLYHLLLKGWVVLFGDHEVATRTLSVLFSTAATCVMARTGGMLAGAGGTLIFGVFHALNPLSISYAQETRMYALFELATALGLFFLLQALTAITDSERRRRWAGFGLASFVSLATHFLAVVPLSLQMGFLVTKQTGPASSREPWARETWAMPGIILLSVGLLVAAVSFFGYFSWTHLGWQAARFEIQPETRWPAEILRVLAGSSIASIAGFVLLLISSLAQWAKQEIDARHPPRLQALSFLILAIVPLAAFTAAGFAFRRSFMLPRYFVYTIPFFVTWAGLSWLWLWKSPFPSGKVLSLAALGAVVTGFILNFGGQYTPRKAPWREAAQLISQSPESIVLTTRTQAVRTPYFENLGIPLERRYFAQEGVDAILEKLKAFETVWIVDNFYGAQAYQEKLRSLVAEKKLRVTDYSMKSEISEPLIILRIENPESKSP